MCSRFADDSRSTIIPPAAAAVAAFRRKSCSGDQYLMSATIDEADTDDDGDCTVYIATDQSSLPSAASVAAANK